MLGAFGPIPGFTSPGGIAVINVQRPLAAITGAGFQTIASFTLPGGSLGTGNQVWCYAVIQQIAGTGLYTLQMTYGATTVATQGASTGSPEPAIKLWGAGGTAMQTGVVLNGYGGTGQGYGTAVEDSTQDLTLAMEMDLATDTDVFVCSSFVAILLRNPS